MKIYKVGYDEIKMLECVEHGTCYNEYYDVINGEHLFYHHTNIQQVIDKIEIEHFLAKLIL